MSENDRTADMLVQCSATVADLRAEVERLRAALSEAADTAADMRLAFVRDDARYTVCVNLAHRWRKIASGSHTGEG
jgi:hypothetical protein